MARRSALQKATAGHLDNDLNLRRLHALCPVRHIADYLLCGWSSVVGFNAGPGGRVESLVLLSERGRKHPPLRDHRRVLVSAMPSVRARRGPVSQPSFRDEQAASATD